MESRKRIYFNSSGLNLGGFFSWKWLILGFKKKIFFGVIVIIFTAIYSMMATEMFSRSVRVQRPKKQSRAPPASPRVPDRRNMSNNFPLSLLQSWQHVMPPCPVPQRSAWTSDLGLTLPAVRSSSFDSCFWRKPFWENIPLFFAYGTMERLQWNVRFSRGDHGTGNVMVSQLVKCLRGEFMLHFAVNRIGAAK